MAVTIEDLARAAGVSTATVSRALNDSNQVSPTTKQRIVNLAEQIGYQPNLIGRSLRMDQTRTIGVITDDITSPFTPRIMRGIQDYLQANGYFSVMINGERNPDLETKALHDLISRSIDGVIFVESYLRGTQPKLDLAGKPYVFVHRLFFDNPTGITVDEKYGTRLAVEHLAQLGHRRIAHISGPPGWLATAERIEGYKAALAEYDIEDDPELIQPGDWLSNSGFIMTQKLLALKKPPTAIFAANDPTALGVIYAIQEAGLRVPDDISVVGYDNQEVAIQARPNITTVTLPCYEMGQTAGKQLLQLLGKEGVSEQPLKIRGELIVRQSSGRAPKRL